jgi:hypothetical protein
MNKRSLFFLALVCFSLNVLSGPAPKVKYWIQLKNKTGTPYTINNPSVFLTPQSISRRTTYNIPVNQTDLPVTPAYIQQIEAINHVQVLYASKWLNSLVISVDSSAVAMQALSAIKSLSFVLDTTKAKKMKLNKFPSINQFDLASRELNESNISAKYKYGMGTGQAYQLEVQCLHETGYRGQGMVIAVCDVGFNDVNTGSMFDSIRNSNGILGTRDFVAGGTNAYQGGSHGTMVFTCLAANSPGIMIGTAPKAKYWLFRTEDGGSETLVEEYNWVRAAEFADSVGVDMITTSLGYTTFDNPAQNHTYATLNGRTAPMSIAANLAARKGIFVLNAAGNEGTSNWKYISVPADADSICTVGAVDTTGAVAAFSSVGPTADGRIKPDLQACGVRAWVSSDGSNIFPGNGTSFATPVLAGAVACFWQKNRSFNNIRILDTLKKGASNGKTPNNIRGWGIPKLCNGITSINTIQANTNFDFNAYASQSEGVIKINFTNKVIEAFQITIRDITGKIILTNYYTTNESQIELSDINLVPGLYLIQVQTSKGVKTKKLLKL